MVLGEKLKYILIKSANAKRGHALRLLVRLLFIIALVIYRI